MRNLILSCMLVLAGGAFQFGPAGQNEKKSEHYSAVAIGTGGSVGRPVDGSLKAGPGRPGYGGMAVV